MIFKIIPNEQTPAIDANIVNVEKFIIVNKTLIEKFLYFAKKQKNCAGLAANQVSLDGERLMLPFFAIQNSYNNFDIIISPNILKYIGEKEEKTEGCLTWIGKKILVDRYPSIKVTYYDIKGTFVERTISGFEAQVWQHEYNHLMGIKENVQEIEE